VARIKRLSLRISHQVEWYGSHKERRGGSRTVALVDGSLLAGGSEDNTIRSGCGGDRLVRFAYRSNCRCAPWPLVPDERLLASGSSDDQTDPVSGEVPLRATVSTRLRSASGRSHSFRWAKYCVVVGDRTKSDAWGCLLDAKPVTNAPWTYQPHPLGGVQLMGKPASSSDDERSSSGMNRQQPISKRSS